MNDALYTVFREYSESWVVLMERAVVDNCIPHQHESGYEVPNLRTRPHNQTNVLEPEFIVEVLLEIVHKLIQKRCGSFPDRFVIDVPQGIIGGYGISGKDEMDNPRLPSGLSLVFQVRRGVVNTVNIALDYLAVGYKDKD